MVIKRFFCILLLLFVGFSLYALSWDEDERDDDFDNEYVEPLFKRKYYQNNWKFGFDDLTVVDYKASSSLNLAEGIHNLSLKERLFFDFSQSIEKDDKGNLTANQIICSFVVGFGTNFSFVKKNEMLIYNDRLIDRLETHFLNIFFEVGLSSKFLKESKREIIINLLVEYTPWSIDLKEKYLFDFKKYHKVKMDAIFLYPVNNIKFGWKVGFAVPIIDLSAGFVLSF